MYQAFKPARQNGFTLIEVMVALVVAAVALTALTQGLGQYVYQQSGVQERVVATWVGQNRLLEIQQSLGGSLNKKTESDMVGQTWQIEFDTEKTLIPGINKIELSVRPKAAKDAPPTAVIYSVIGDL